MHRARTYAAAVAVALIIVVAGAGPAAGQEQPPPSPTTVPVPVPVVPPDAVPFLGDDLADIVNADVTAGCTQPAGGVGEELVPDGCWGQFPSSNYDIGCDEGAWNHLSRKVYCTFTDLAFQGARTSTAVAAWIAGWAYSFEAADLVADPAIAMARAFDTRLVGPLDLGDLAWFVMVAWVGITALRGRTTHAAGEFVVSVLMVGMAGLLLANPAGYLQGTYETMNRLSTVTLAAGTGTTPPAGTNGSDEVVAPIQAQLHRSFVEEPYNVINWGTATLPAPCAGVRDQIVASGPHGADDAPRQAMEAAGCDDLADFNQEPTAQRMFGAVLAMIAALIMVILIGLVSLTVIVAQLAVAVAFVLLPFAAAAAVLPGAGRGLAIRWVTMVLRAVIAMVGMSFLLAVVLIFISALLAGSDAMPMFARFALVDVAVVVAILGRKRLVTAGHTAAASFGATATAARPGGRGGPSRPVGQVAAAGMSGFGLAAGNRQPPGALRRGAQTVGRYKLQERAFNRRSGQTHAVERTDLGVDGAEHRSTSVTGPAPATRRARAARNRVEHAARTRMPTPATADQTDDPVES